MGVEGLILKLIGGSPLQKSAGSTIDLLRLPKTLDMGNVGSILRDVMQNGPGALMANPLGAVTGQLQGAIGGAVGQLASATGIDVSAVTGALGQLDAAASAFGSATSLLSGATTPGDGQFGLLDVAAHAGMAAGFGDALPAGLGLDTVLAPMGMGGTIASIAGWLPGIASGVASGMIAPGAAAAEILGHADALTASVAASHGAMSTLQNAAVALSSVGVAASALVSEPGPLRAHVEACLHPAAATALGAAVADHLETIFNPGGTP